MANEVVETSKAKLVDNVIARVNQLTSGSGFMLPDGYAVENALRAAYFIIGDTVNKDGQSALATCDPASISEALFRMAAAGLDPVKSQCYFIVHGKKLVMRRSYQGSIVVGKRVANVKKVSARTVHEGDNFKYDIIDGDICNLQHTQDAANVDKPMAFAYAVCTFEDGTKYIDVMTIAQVKKSWKMAINQNNNKLQTDFDVEAAKRTAIQRCMKPVINNSTDDNLFHQEPVEENEVEETTHEVVTEKKVLQVPVKAEAVKAPVKEKEPEPIQDIPAYLADDLDEEEGELETLDSE